MVKNARTCAKLCIDEWNTAGARCNSISYDLGNRNCFLNTADSQTAADFTAQDDYHFYEFVGYTELPAAGARESENNDRWQVAECKTLRGSQCVAASACTYLGAHTFPDGSVWIKFPGEKIERDTCPRSNGFTSWTVQTVGADEPRGHVAAGPAHCAYICHRSVHGDGTIGYCTGFNYAIDTGMCTTVNYVYAQ